MQRKISLLALALILALSAVALAGGEKCAHQGKEAHDARKAKLAGQGWLGLANDKNDKGEVRVVSVNPNSPAAKAGFRPGDVLVAFNDIAMTNENGPALMKAKQSQAVGQQVSYTVRRDGAEKKLTAKLAPVPDAILALWMDEEEKALAQRQARKN